MSFNDILLVLHLSLTIKILPNILKEVLEEGMSLVGIFVEVPKLSAHARAP